MSTQETGLSAELQQQSEAFQRDALPKLPPDSVATLRDTTEDLVKSGSIAKHSVKEGLKHVEAALNYLVDTGEKPVYYTVHASARHPPADGTVHPLRDAHLRWPGHPRAIVFG